MDYGKLSWFCLAVTFTCVFVGFYYWEYIGEFLIVSTGFLFLAYVSFFIMRLNDIDDRLDKLQSSIEEKRRIV